MTAWPGPTAVDICSPRQPDSQPGSQPVRNWLRIALAIANCMRPRPTNIRGTDLCYSVSPRIPTARVTTETAWSGPMQVLGSSGQAGKIESDEINSTFANVGWVEN